MKMSIKYLLILLTEELVRIFVLGVFVRISLILKRSTHLTISGLKVCKCEFFKKTTLQVWLLPNVYTCDFCTLKFQKCKYSFYAVYENADSHTCPISSCPFFYATHIIRTVVPIVIFTFQLLYTPTIFR